MPKLLIFAPCESVIVSREGPISLINVIEGLNISPTEEEEAIPDDAVVPIIWHVLTLWHREDDEEPQHWEQRIQVSMSNGRVATDTITGFDLVANQAMRSIVAIDGFPIRPLGRCKVVLTLRKAGQDDTAWREIASYPIRVDILGQHT